MPLNRDWLVRIRKHWIVAVLAAIYTIVSALSAAPVLLSPEAARKITLYPFVSKVGWHVWAMGILILVIAGLCENYFHLIRDKKRQVNEINGAVVQKEKEVIQAKSARIKTAFENEGLKKELHTAQLLAESLNKQLETARIEIDRLTYPEDSPDLRIEKWQQRTDGPRPWGGFLIRNQGKGVAKNVRLQPFSVTYATRKITISLGGSPVPFIDPGEKREFLSVSAISHNGSVIAQSQGWALASMFDEASKARQNDWEHDEGIPFNGGEIHLTYEGLNDAKYYTVTNITYQPGKLLVREAHFEFEYVRRGKGKLTATTNTQMV